MITAIVGCRQLSGYSYADFCGCIPPDITHIISGGATGIDGYARRYARERGIAYTEIRPNYDLYPPRQAPIIRNREIVDRSQQVLAFWDGRSRGTRSVIHLCIELGKPYRIFDISSGA